MIVRGKFLVINGGGGGAGQSTVDTTFEALEITSEILIITFDILRPNKAFTIDSDITIWIDSINNGNNGQLHITKTTGTEHIELIGNNTATIPTTSGTFTLNYSYSSGILTWS